MKNKMPDDKKVGEMIDFAIQVSKEFFDISIDRIIEKYPIPADFHTVHSMAYAYAFAIMCINQYSEVVPPKPSFESFLSHCKEAIDFAVNHFNASIEKKIH